MKVKEPISKVQTRLSQPLVGIVPEHHSLRPVDDSAIPMQLIITYRYQCPNTPPPKLKTKTIHESAFPVFWVEVLDEAHQNGCPLIR